MFSGFSIILLPLIVGYLIPLSKLSILKFISYCLNLIVYIILFFMGISLSFLGNMFINLLTVFYYSIITIMVILFCNISSLLLLEYIIPWNNNHPRKEENLSFQVKVNFELLKLFSLIIFGFLVGLTGFSFFRYITEASKYTLIFLLFLIGIQFRSSGMKIKQIFFNRRAVLIAIVVVASSLVAGILNAFILNLPINIGLAMASGFGWYSLSKILLTKSFGPLIGSVAFFNDLAREIFAIILVPWILRKSRSTALGLCGATSMDFALPVLQQAGGLDLVPVAIAHGFILSLLVPILINFFSS